MKIAVEGCAHGELDTIYDTIKYVEEQEDIKIDLLICCGDFQSTRNEADLKCMAVPPKYSKMCSFYKYYNGEKEAPILTIFIGGNHEASNYLQELPYGGWVAPNIYYLGYAGVINVAGIRIGGLSGIYKGRDYMKGHFEKPPYDDNTKRSVYHIRNLEVFRLKQISDKLDIFLSHDWPTGICDFGNKEQLIKFKPFFKEDIESGKLGSKPCEELLHTLKPSYWFAAHLHCKFAALVQHEDDKKTKFLALDKCLPKRRFLQIIDLPTDPSEEVAISYDVEWLTVLFMTNHLINVKNVTNYMPGPAGNERWNFTPTEEEKLTTMKQFNNDLKVPLNFQKTVLGFVPDSLKKTHISQPSPKANPQTVSFCKKLGIDDPIALLTDLNDSIISIDDTINSSLDDSVIFVPDTPMRKLNLPQPKMDSSSDLIEVSNLSILSRGSSDEPKTDLSQEFNEYEKSEQSPNEEEKNEFQTEISDTPLRKKFKRRNATMYDTEAV